MKCLVTGDAGFVGRHMVEYLKAANWEVYGMDIATDPDEDVLDFFRTDDDEYYDLVVHCAYEVGGRAHIDGVNMALTHNVNLDSALFDWALRTDQGAVLYFSSSAAYPVEYQQKDTLYQATLHEGMINQHYDLRNPDGDYGWAKLTGERMADRASANGLRVHVVRPFSGYGADQDLNYPFPSIVKRASQNDLTVWGPKGQTRDWIHIRDVVAGAYTIYDDDERRPVNLCTGIATEMGELASTINLSSGGRWGLPYYLEDKPTGVFHRVGDPTRMNEHYTATISLEEGIMEALDGQTT